MRPSLLLTWCVALTLTRLNPSSAKPCAESVAGDSFSLLGTSCPLPSPFSPQHGYCLSILDEHLKPGNRVLDVGSGSGYLTAVMALMVGPLHPKDATGKV